MVVGDFNISAMPIPESLKKMILALRPAYGPMINDLDSEHKLMLDYFNKAEENEVHELIDYGSLHNAGVAPATMIGGRHMKKGGKDGFANSDATFEMSIDYILEKRILN